MRIRCSHPVLVVGILVLCCILGAPTGAAAQGNTPVGLWRLTFHMDNAPFMNQTAIQNVCFLANGQWFGTTFPAWAGRWFQKGLNAAGHGDRVRLVGNYANGVGNDSAELDFVNVNLMTGPWSEFRDFFNFVYWGRVSLVRIGSCVGPAPFAPETAVDDGTNPGTRFDAPQPVCTEPNGGTIR